MAAQNYILKASQQLRYPVQVGMNSLAHQSRPHLPNETSIATQILWNFMQIRNELIEVRVQITTANYKLQGHHHIFNCRQSDVVIVIGNYDPRTYQYACQLWTDGWSNHVMYTGTSDSSTDTDHFNLPALSLSVSIRLRAMGLSCRANSDPANSRVRRHGGGEWNPTQPSNLRDEIQEYSRKFGKLSPDARKAGNQD